MLGLIGLLLEYHGLRYERLDGMVRGIERQRAIDRFDTDTDIFAFLLSTKAGGVGLNLQSELKNDIKDTLKILNNI